MARVLLLTLVLVSLATAAYARKRKTIAKPDSDYASAPSYKYGKLSAAACHKELRSRKIRFEKVDKAPGVRAPVRIPKGLRGIRFHTLLPDKEAKKSPWEVFDCRLVLALHDFAEILKDHGIDEVLIFSAWRPNRRAKKGKEAKRHPGGLAVDIMRLGGRDENGERVWLDVKKDWHGRIGHKTCGPKASKPTKKSAAATRLRTMVCKAAKARLFTSMLTPNYDRAHHNHFHFDVTPNVKWRMVR